MLENRPDLATGQVREAILELPELCSFHTPLSDVIQEKFLDGFLV